MAANAQDASAPLKGAAEKKEDVYEEDCKLECRRVSSLLVWISGVLSFLWN